MRAVFLSNFFNHHQKGISDELYALTGGDYMFVATEHMNEERIRLGWALELPPYVRYMDPEKPDREVMDFIDSADFAVIGSAPKSLVSKRLRHGGITFAYAERLYKQEPEWYRLIYHRFKFGRYFFGRKNAFLLCASAYVADDFSRIGLFRGRAFRWGYFPALCGCQDPAGLLSAKRPSSILWVGRLIDWKHPELPVKVARRLRDEGIQFSMEIIGTGAMEEEMRAMVESEGLSDNVTLVGAVPHSEVRSYMEKSGIFLFTSDRGEGWGAVLNEAMSSACAVVACREAGSVPYLVRDGIDGIVFDKGDFGTLYSGVKRLLEDRDLRMTLSSNAFGAISRTWSPKNAASRLVSMAEALAAGKPSPFSDGPCSPDK